MRRLIGYSILLALHAAVLPERQLSAQCNYCLAQNIFDEDTPPESEVTENSADADETEKPRSAVKPTKKRKKLRKRKRQVSQPQSSDTQTQELTPQELARQSYAWAPEPGFRLKSTAPGIKAADAAPVSKAVSSPDVIDTPVKPQGFKLPQIPVTQVLIVAGFVILFLIYRFRVGRQMKRRKY